MAAIDWDASNTSLASGGLAGCRVGGQDLVAGFEAAIGTTPPLASRTRAGDEAAVTAAWIYVADISTGVSCDLFRS